jgi:hypothetical protein
MASSAPPVRALLERLDAGRRAGLREAFVDHWCEHADGFGRVRKPRPYLLVLGRRRA